jgi:hypothetical protein
VGKFSAQVSGAVAKRKAAMVAIFKESVQRTVEIAQTPGPSVANPGGGMGGHLPIDTGFLRASLSAVLGARTPPAIEKPDGQARHTYDEGAVNLVIASATLNDTITVAYAANYARFVHRRYQWVSLAAQRWPQTVAQVTKEVEWRLGL